MKRLSTLLLMSLTVLSITVHAQSSRKMTMMFYLDNQNGDYVDDYVNRVHEKVSYYSQIYSKLPIQWIVITNENNSRRMKDQRLIIKTYTNGNTKEIRELNGMAFSSPETLNLFTEEGLKLGSEINTLIMVDHGLGDGGIMTTDLVTEKGREIRALSNIQVASSIVKAENTVGKKLDLIIMDACLMGSIEAFSDFLANGLKAPIVTSENTTLPTDGGANYDQFFSLLAKAKTKITAIDLGKLFITANKNNLPANFSLIDLKVLQVNMVLEQFQAVNNDLLKLVAKYKNDIRATLNDLRPSPAIQGGVYDLQTLLETFEKFSKDEPSLRQKLTKIKASLKPVVLMTENDNSESKETGISVRISIGGINPSVKEQKLKTYSDQSFAQKTKWNELIKLFMMSN